MCKSSLLLAVGGPEALKREMQQAQVPDSAAQQQAIMHDSRGHRFSIVRAGDCFGDWGVVKRQKCQTCPSQRTKCRHVLRTQGSEEGDGEAAEWLSTEAFERKINEVTELRWLLCMYLCSSHVSLLSFISLPEDISDWLGRTWILRTGNSG